MYRERAGILSRGGPAIAVIGLHILVVYGLVVSMGIVEMPKFAAPVQAVFIDQPAAEPEPEIKVKPQIEEMAVDEPLPEVQFDEPIAPPTEEAMPASEAAIAAKTADMGAISQDLKTKTRTEPVYPPISRRLGEEGSVRLKVLVNERGRPQDVQIAQSSGFERLDRAAMEAVRRWTFAAATNGSMPISAWTQVNVTFKLTQS